MRVLPIKRFVGYCLIRCLNLISYIFTCFLNMTISCLSQQEEPNISQMLIRKTLVPIVPIDEQKRIVSEISIEMSIVEQNKRLIEIFQQKIKDKIAEVWGA